MTMRKSAPASTGVATIKPFCAGERARSLAICTPSGPSTTQTMNARSKYRKAANRVGGCPAFQNEVFMRDISVDAKGLAVEPAVALIESLMQAVCHAESGAARRQLRKRVTPMRLAGRVCARAPRRCAALENGASESCCHLLAPRQMLQWQIRRLLHFLERETGLRVLHPRQRHQRIEREP